MDNTPIAGDEKAAGRLTGMIGLARRAGRLTFGFDAVIQDISTGKAKAVLLSDDASERTAKKIKEACERFSARIAVLPVSKARLGRSIGRDDTAVIAIIDKAFANKIFELASISSQSIPTVSPEEFSGERSKGQTETGGN